MSGLEAFGQLLKTTRESKGWSQRQVAARMERDASFVSRWETAAGKIMPEPEVLRLFGRALDIPRYHMLRALGFVDDDDREPGVAYVIREDDPRAMMLAMLEDMPPAEIEAFAGTVATLRRVMRPGYTRNQNDVVHPSEGDASTKSA